MCDSCSVKEIQFICRTCLDHIVCSKSCYNADHVCEPYYYLVGAGGSKRQREGEQSDIEKAREEYEKNPSNENAKRVKEAYDNLSKEERKKYRINYLLNKLYATGDENLLEILLQMKTKNKEFPFFEPQMFTIDIYSLKKYFTKLSGSTLAKLFENYENTIGYDNYLDNHFDFWLELVKLVENKHLFNNFAKERVKTVREWPSFYYEYIKSYEHIDPEHREYTSIRIYPNTLEKDDVVNAYVDVIRKHKNVQLIGDINLVNEFFRFQLILWINNVIPLKDDRIRIQSLEHLLTNKNAFDYIYELFEIDIERYRTFTLAMERPTYKRIDLIINDIVDPKTNEVLLKYLGHEFLFETVYHYVDFFNFLKNYVVIINAEEVLDGGSMYFHKDLMTYIKKKEEERKGEEQSVILDFKVIPKVENPKHKIRFEGKQIHSGESVIIKDFDDLRDKEYNYNIILWNKYYGDKKLLNIYNTTINRSEKQLMYVLVKYERIPGFEYEIKVNVRFFY